VPCVDLPYIFFASCLHICTAVACRAITLALSRLPARDATHMTDYVVVDDIAIKLAPFYILKKHIRKPIANAMHTGPSVLLAAYRIQSYFQLLYIS